MGIVGGELTRTGSISVPGLLTVGDIDLHLRVEPAAFEPAVTQLRQIYQVAHAGIWTEQMATFAIPDDDVEVAVTVIGSEHDRRFTDAWRRLRQDAELRAAYNDLKRRHEASDDDTYRAAKSQFFDDREREAKEGR